MEELKDWIIEELPPEGEWRNAGGWERFIEAAEKMFKANMDTEEIKDILLDLYGAVACEYGR